MVMACRGGCGYLSTARSSVADRARAARRAAPQSFVRSAHLLHIVTQEIRDGRTYHPIHRRGWMAPVEEDLFTCMGPVQRQEIEVRETVLLRERRKGLLGRVLTSRRIDLIAHGKCQRRDTKPVPPGVILEARQLAIDCPPRLFSPRRTPVVLREARQFQKRCMIVLPIEPL